MTLSPTFPLTAGAADDDFQQRLFDLVDQEMAALTSAGALDEWHLDYLDPRIAGEVVAEQHRIDLADEQRQRDLAARRRALADRAERLVHELAEADVAVARTGADLERRIAEAHGVADSSDQPSGGVSGTGSISQAEALLSDLGARSATLAEPRSSWPWHRRVEPELRRELVVARRALREAEETLGRRRAELTEASARHEAARVAFHGPAYAEAYDHRAEEDSR